MSHNLIIDGIEYTPVEKILIPTADGSKAEFIVPTETINITKNGTHNVRQYENAVVSVQPSSDYIKKADTWLYTTKPNFACGQFKPSSDTAISSASITSVGFKPKIFIIRAYDGFNTTSSSKYYIANSWFVMDNNYAFTSVSPTSGESTRTGNTNAIYYNSSKASSAQSNSTTNLFSPTASGVVGSGSSSSYYFQAGKAYFWYAWG